MGVLCHVVLFSTLTLRYVVLFLQPVCVHVECIVCMDCLVSGHFDDCICHNGAPSSSQPLTCPQLLSLFYFFLQFCSAVKARYYYDGTISKQFDVGVFGFI